jgi:small basic protein
MVKKSSLNDVNMRYSLLGLLVGLLIGYVVQVDIPIEYTKYSAVVIIGLIDALLGAVRADITKDGYNTLIFLSGLFFNIILAVGITYLGDRLGLDLYLAATVVFTYRIFLNVGIIRRSLLKRWT